MAARSEVVQRGRECRETATAHDSRERVLGSERGCKCTCGRCSVLCECGDEHDAHALVALDAETPVVLGHKLHARRVLCVKARRRTLKEERAQRAVFVDVVVLVNQR